MKNKVLLIEDNQDIRENAAELLELYGFEVLVADCGEAGLYLTDLHPDLIISDVVMPGISGYDVFNQLQEDSLKKNIPFIFTTALSEKRDQDIAKVMGIQNYLIKPYDEAEFINCIRKCLDII
ncbi:response regulator [Mucilaginibacter gossypii]|uniref:response regulator n=1 Tax=Mucilaginibacter gossypii TaxID=551996 RepID=UPI000DCDCB81|nr:MULTISPECIES: response regulator [Mucilaginibacter]QTE38210.1 response regulator [Mucilaginibacter gossypii]RAV60316.1 response regulator [Mucilaginibacter rubeus]